MGFYSSKKVEQKINKNNTTMRKFNRKVAFSFLALVVVSSYVLPGFISPALAADFNEGSQPYSTLRVSNYTANPGCSTCWDNNSVSADVDDVVSLGVFVNNTSSETANSTKVSIESDVASDGESVDFTVEIWASNADPISDTVTVNVSGGNVDSVDHVSTSVRDNFGDTKSFSGSEDSVMTSSGIGLGNILPGRDNSRIVVVRIEIVGDGNDDDNNGDDPQVTTRNAEDIDDNSAMLVCDVEAGDADTDVWFEWGEDNDDLDEDTSKVNVDANDNDTVEKTITGLDEDTKYYFRCLAEDDDGNEDTGSIKSFTTDEDGGSDSNANEPDVVTLPATGVSNTSATLRGEVDPNGDDTDAWFEWGTSRTNLNRTTSSQDMGDGSRDVSFSANISGLSADTTYYFRAMAENGEGEDQGSILSFRTTSPIVNVVTRFVDVFRTVEVAPEPEVEALIITLNANTRDVDRREIDYTVSYDNRTGLTLTDVVLTVPMPSELDFISSDPRESLNRDGELVFNIGTVRPGEQDSFLIETELANGVDANDEIRFVANVGYNDNSRVRKIVEVIDESTFGELSTAGGFTAAMIDAFRGLFTNPLLWIILFVLLVTFAVRYMLAAKDKRTNVLV